MKTKLAEGIRPGSGEEFIPNVHPMIFSYDTAIKAKVKYKEYS
jgi:hypothetical protein